jgi:lipid II:glycine glycyltransferase (peptidoglycan interpeptide bridge formation enzyme)
MKITTQPIAEKTIWENYISTHKEANFLSSWNWGQFHTNLGKKVFYRGYYQDDHIVGTALIVKEAAKRGPYFTIAGGPVLDWDNKELINVFIEDLKDLARKENVWFVRVRPQILDTQENRQLFRNLGFKSAPMHLTADLTLQLDLSKPLDTLLKEMRKTTRYEINRYEKMGITVTESQDPDEIKPFFEKQLELAKKHGFVPFSYRFLHEQFKAFNQDKEVYLFSSYKDKKLLAQAFVIMDGEEAVYHYGISTPDNFRLPGSYACQWAAIKKAKELGLTRYNFWGIAPEGANKHRFAGVSLFKRGFGGNEVAYLPAHDLPLSPLYSVVSLFESLRAKARRLA